MFLLQQTNKKTHKTQKNSISEKKTAFFKRYFERYCSISEKLVQMRFIATFFGLLGKSTGILSQAFDAFRHLC